MAAKKPKLPDDNALLEELQAQFFANIALQLANGKETEEKFTILNRKRRDTIKRESKIKFGGFTPAQNKKIKRSMKSDDPRT